MADRIYIAATSQHVGKTTCTLGIYKALYKRGYNVGYCKPVGQEFVDLGDLKVDKDALLFARMMNFDLEADLHSPVIVGSGLTTAYLDNPVQFHFRERLELAADMLHKKHDFVLYEGTGHPGVGSVIDLSNADVAKIVGASLIMIVEGGIGSTIDELNANLALFREQAVPIRGVILNKVLPEKVDKVTHYVGKKLKQMGIPLLGVLPFDKSLTYPLMDSVRRAIKGKTVFNEDKLDNWVGSIVSGALVERRELEEMSRVLLIVNHRRLDHAIEIIEEITRKRQLEHSPLSGIIVNGEDDFLPAFLEQFKRKDYVDAHQIPVVATTLDTFGAALKINRIEVKINLRTPWKVQRAIELFNEYVNWDDIA